MFETEEFRNLVRRNVREEAAMRGMKKYNPRIIGHLQSLAVKNERILMARERLLEESQQRGVQHAMGSVRVVMREAAANARRAGRTTLMLEDVEAAYEAKFCTLWPFCRPK
jgi:histone H3/H4